MVFIHGGGYQFGFGSYHKEMDWHPLAAIGDVIVVSTNYRLNAFGFLSTGRFLKIHGDQNYAAPVVS